MVTCVPRVVKGQQVRSPQAVGWHEVRWPIVQRTYLIPAQAPDGTLRCRPLSAISGCQVTAIKKSIARGADAEKVALRVADG